MEISWISVDSGAGHGAACLHIGGKWRQNISSSEWNPRQRALLVFLDENCEVGNVMLPRPWLKTHGPQAGLGFLPQYVKVLPPPICEKN